jgi:PTH1 family peptidyl-tRNA hydrolase
MKLIVGLGNPGLLYKNTRHNVGFEAIEAFCNENNIKLNTNKYDGVFAIETINEQKVLVLRPLKYINLSGEVIAKFINFYNIAIEDVLIVHDDMDLELGRFKLKESGSSAGHNGLKNIEEQLKTQDYKRLKIGISKNNELNKRDYVLGKFNKNEKLVINDIIKESTSILNDFLYISFSNLMNKYNKK